MKRLLIIILILVGWMPTPTHAYAPAAVVKSDPADGTMITAPPDQLRLWFNQPIWLQAKDIRLETSAGESIAIEYVMLQVYQPQPENSDAYEPNYVYLCSLGKTTLPTLLVLDLPKLQPNSYKLSWNATATFTQQSASGSLVFAVGEHRANTATNVRQQHNDLLIETSVKPNLPGHNFIDVTIANTRRPAPAPISSVMLDLVSPDQQTTRMTAVDLHDNHFQIAGDALNQAGTWNMTITIKRDGLPDTVMALPWTVGAPAAPEPQPVVQAPASSPLPWLIVAGIVITVALAWLYRSHARLKESV
ncbi:MAG: copper resistance protein CopC [Herpetosiphon sp.]|nr:copper resistance protein CopC [Herpetosiphon sp.]